MSEKINYSVIVEARDENGKVIKDAHGLAMPEMKFQLDCTPGAVEFFARTYAHTLKTWMPNRKLNIYFHTFNEFTKTWPCDFSFYVEEDRFVKHE